MPGPLPPESTTRIYVHYTSLGIGHVCEVRVAVAGSTAVFADLAQDIADINAQRMHTSDSSTRAEYSSAGSNIRFPLPHSPTPGVIGGSPFWQQDPESAMLSVVGKGSVTGRRWRYCLFTPCSPGFWPAKNRFAPGMSPVIDTFLENVELLTKGLTATGLPIVSIGSDPPIVNQYVNISLNAYWQRAQR